ncbi:transglycosylase SLT domain-containing protein [Qingshengfaniella alkalisoli]|uniref:Lytic transglycosylase n=1 Tax=Qingshengfaniella alkalisoli TaxID=2599296 RepID=A0A5B8J1K6_9RHOB|nr:transglycosylase SLT domain-containing protein [Qingshengfaniella alkalisoli]QDY68357.1 lytic transglycosylase [Qingshengfaniella alkalisoli]
MSSRLCALGLVLILSACGGDSPPSDLENACAIVAQRPQYLRAMKKAEKKWGVPVAVQMATIHQESKFDSDARTPHEYFLGVIPMGRQSSAFGYAQALDGTWDDYKATVGRRGAKRDNINDATDFMGWYMNTTAAKNGISKSDARNQYLAYHEGHAGYARGNHYKKSWLLGVADSVAARAVVYDHQLRACRRI